MRQRNSVDNFFEIDITFHRRFVQSSLDSENSMTSKMTMSLWSFSKNHLCMCVNEQWGKTHDLFLSPKTNTVIATEGEMKIAILEGEEDIEL